MSGKFFSTGLIFLLVASIASVIGGVWVCAYLYKEGKRKSQIRPADEPSAKMVEPFNTKKLWERGKRKAVLTLVETESIKSISVNGVVAKENSGGACDEEAMAGDVPMGGINPSVAMSPSPVPAVKPLSPQKQNHKSPPNEAASAATAVEVS